MSIQNKLGSSNIVEETKKCDTVTITEFHTTVDVNQLVYAITCDCVGKD